MTFSAALEHLKDGTRVARSGWNGKGMSLTIVPRDYLDTTVLGEAFLPFIAMFPVGGGVVPWLASQTDILAEDWETVP